jgi:hypothetical protein
MYLYGLPSPEEIPSRNIRTLHRITENKGRKTIVRRVWRPFPLTILRLDAATYSSTFTMYVKIRTHSQKIKEEKRL